MTPSLNCSYEVKQVKDLISTFVVDALTWTNIFTQEFFSEYFPEK